MRLMKFAMAGTAAASMLVASGAIAAGPVRSAAAVPAVQSAPVNGVRAAPALKHRSSQSDEGTPVLGYALAGVFAAGLVAATIVATDHSSDSTPPSSPG
ncbi:hypothetical protein K7G81_14695 [Hephaestia sp. CMS5P-6]|nr:hypothetical protein [Hephaestia mangrovi]